MAATTGAALVSLGLGAYQMYEASENKKEATDAANQARQNLAAIEEQNAFADLQAPDIVGHQEQLNARSHAQTIEALKQMGPEGAAMVTALEMGARESNLATAQVQGQAVFETDKLRAQNEAAIEARRAYRDERLFTDDLENAHTKLADSEAQQAAATKGLIKGAGDLALGIGKATSLGEKSERKQKDGLSPSDRIGPNGELLSYSEDEVLESGFGTDNYLYGG